MPADVISPERLFVASDSEAAAVYCRNLTPEQLAPYSQSLEPFTSTSYIVVKIGQETAEISAHQLSSPVQYVEVILPPAGNNCGDSMVNKNFAEFLGRLIDDKGFTRYVDTGDETLNTANKADLNVLVNEKFEQQKRIFGSKGGKGNKLSIRLPFSFMEVYHSQLKKGMQKLNDPRIQLSINNLRITYPKMREFFQPVVMSVLHYIAETLLKSDIPINAIYIIGAFGGCEYVYNAITKQFGDSYKCVTPARPDDAAVCGAVLLGQLHNQKGKDQCESIVSIFVASFPGHSHL